MQRAVHSNSKTCKSIRHFTWNYQWIYCSTDSTAVTNFSRRMVEGRRCQRTRTLNKWLFFPENYSAVSLSGFPRPFPICWECSQLVVYPEEYGVFAKAYEKANRGWSHPTRLISHLVCTTDDPWKCENSLFKWVFMDMQSQTECAGDLAEVSLLLHEIIYWLFYHYKGTLEITCYFSSLI